MEDMPVLPDYHDYMVFRNIRKEKSPLMVHPYFGGDMEKRTRNGRGLARLINAARCSRQGLGHIWRHEEAFRLECVLLAPGLVLALVLGSTGCEQALLAGSLLLVLLVEILNTAVECAIDRIGPERHPLSGAAKDLGSTAVSLALVLAVLVWILVLLG